MNEPKILYFDIETAANLGFVWGKYEQNVLSYEREWYMMSFAYRCNNGRTKAYALPDFDVYGSDPHNDVELVRKLWELFDEADIIVGHNGDAFDIKKTNARFLFHGFNPPSGYKTIDTLKVAKKYFKFNSNKLDDLGELLGVGRKISTGGWDLWKGCINGDMKSWSTMVKYNKQDVDLLFNVYMKLRGWMTNHPNVNLYKEEDGRCPICGGTHMQKRGFGYNKTGKYQRYQCLECGGWSKGKNITVIKEIK